MGILELRNIWFKYPGMENYVLKGISLELKSGKTYFITGPNGAGKTTLLMVAAGLLKPEKGEVIFQGKPLSKQLPEARRHIGVLFQNPEAMLFNPTVYDEVAYGLRQILSSQEEIDRKVKDTIRRIGLNENILYKLVHKLSYGEKKLVAFASIISYDPKVLLLDEPFTNLSHENIEQIMSIILDFKSKGKTILMVGHDSSGMKENIVDKKFYLDNGELKSL